MQKQDILFKIGLALQVVLIPVAFLWHFTSEAYYYNWVITACFLIIITLFLWPQVIGTRIKRLRAIRLQFCVVLVVLLLSVTTYGYFHHFASTNCAQRTLAPGKDPAVGPYTVSVGHNCNSKAKDYEPGIFYSVGPVATALKSGISVPTAAVMTLIFITLPAANAYRYFLDKKRIRGIKKDDIFA